VGERRTLDKINQTLRILITGGFGYLGGRIALSLCENGHQVVLGSRKKQSTPNWLPKSEVVKLIWDDKDSLTEACRNVDAVIHAAGMNAQDCIEDPVAALEFNGVATARLVEAACKVGMNQIIYLSTAHVYSNPLQGKVSEDTCPHNSHPYATSHLAGESTVWHALNQNLIRNVKILRLSNAFGRPLHKHVNCWSLLVNDLCRQAVTTGKMTIKSNGTQVRDFISLSDVCSVVEHLINKKANHYNHHILNVGFGKSMSVLEMAKVIQARCNVVLGFDPILKHSNNEPCEQQERFEFCLDSLANLGIPLEGKINYEIDELLLRCKKWFKSSFDLTA
jgi:UDP-glucose 4-epimerase